MFGRLLPLLMAAGAIHLCASAPLQFEWSNPLPHRQRWVDMASGNGVAVGLTDGFGGRRIFNSTNGQNWTHASDPAGVPLLRAKFANNNFIAVGNQDTILTSPDGNDWTLRHADPTKAALFDVASGNGVTVAVGYNAEILASADFKKWASIAGLGSGYSFASVEYGNGRFVAIAPYHLWTSTDGFTWTESPWPQDASVFSSLNVAFSNGVFIMNAGQILTSLDGIHWKAASGAQFRKVVPTPGGFLGIWPTLSKSADGVNWQILLDYAGDYQTDLEAATALGTNLVTGGTDGLLFVGQNGTNFQKIVDEEVDRSHARIAYGNSNYIRFGDQPGVEISPDGAAWTTISNAPAMKSAAFGNGAWVGVAADGSLLSSIDARAWGTKSAPLPATKVTFANNLFIAETGGPSIEISRDGSNWSQVTVPEAQFVNIIGNVNGRWTALIDWQRPAISDDGEHWIAQPAQNGLLGNVFAAGNGRFVAIAGGGMGSGMAAWSTDGINWNSAALTSGTTHVPTSLTFGGGAFLLTDDYGDIYTSTDGVNWIGQREAEQPFNAAAYGNGRWVISGGDSILHSSAIRQASVGVILQLTQQDFTNWSLTLQGTAGDTYRIETASTLGQTWAPVQSVQIPIAGRIQISVPANTSAAFFRAVNAN